MSEANGEAPDAATSEARTPEQEEQRAALFGPHGRGEFREGSIVRFRDAARGGKEFIGIIDFIRGPAPAYLDGPMMPTVYFIDVRDGSPHVAFQADIIAVVKEP